MTTVAVPVMLGLGAWQLQRRDWKEAQLAALARAPAQPPVALGATLPPGLNFRRAAGAVTCPPQAPDPRAGRSPQGVSGFALRLRCSAGAPLVVVGGWVPSDGLARAQSARVSIAGQLQGTLIEDAAGYHLYPDAVLPELAAAGARVPAAAPTLDTIPNNHLSYAGQWFGFAAIWLIIYGLWARGRVAAARRAD